MTAESALGQELDVLFENDDLLVCVKPRGILSAKDTSGKRSMADLLAPREIFPVHRLDREVTGLMVFAKTKEAAGFLSAQMSEGFAKEYLALCEGAPPQRGGLTDLLYHDRGKNKTYVVKRPRAGVKEARLTYQALAQLEGQTLLHVRLHTGRTHQIRVQLASRGFPLLGDRKYGSKHSGELQLYSYRLTFPLPRKGGSKSFVLPQGHLPEVIVAACKTAGFVL